MSNDIPEEDGPLPPNLTLLRRLVTVLTVVMIGGVITVVFLLVIMAGQVRRPVLVHPDVFTFPLDVETVGYSVLNGYTILVGDDGVIRVYASDTREQVGELDTSALPAE